MSVENELKKCPHCGREVFAKAIKCKHCKQFMDGEQGLTGMQDKEEYYARSFCKTLFDFNMKELITPKIIRFVYIAGLLILLVGVVFGLVTAFLTGEVLIIILALVAATLGYFAAAVLLRIHLELVLVLFRIYDELQYANRG